MKNISRIAIFCLIASAPFCGSIHASLWRAFSISAFMSAHRSCANNPCPDNVLSCGGITLLHGYIVDKAAHDIILIGEAIPGLPALHIQDIIVALRNAYYVYAEKKNNTIMYSAPTCSIDPDPAMLKKLADIGMAIVGRQLSDEQFDAEMKKWKSVCMSPQTVRIMGIPYDTRFAHVMVEADYELKKLVDGSTQLDIEGFKSHTEMILDLSREEFMAGKRVSAAPSMMNRFWFAPGDFDAVECDGAVMIESMPVRLLTEQEMIAASGVIKQKGVSDPLAARFAALFGKNYARIGKNMPVFQELEALYRLAFAAKSIHESDAFALAGMDAQYLLTTCRLKDVAVARTVPGWSHFDQLKCQRDEHDGVRMAHFRIPSCGGVSMDIRNSAAKARGEKEQELKSLEKSVIESRPGAKTLAWDFKPKTK